jgi:hypothetical protein
MSSEKRSLVQHWVDEILVGLQHTRKVSPPSDTASFPASPELDGEELTHEEANMLNNLFKGRLRGGDGAGNHSLLRVPVRDGATSVSAQVQNRFILLETHSPRHQYRERNIFLVARWSTSESEECKGHARPDAYIPTFHDTKLYIYHVAPFHVLARSLYSHRSPRQSYGARSLNYHRAATVRSSKHNCPSHYVDCCEHTALSCCTLLI